MKTYQAIAQQAAKNIKTEQDLNEFSQMLTKITIEAALNAELDNHLGFARHEKANKNNSRNDFSGRFQASCRLKFKIMPPHSSHFPG